MHFLSRVKITVEDTPNPDARMFILSRSISPDVRRSYLSVEEAAGDALAEQLFAIADVVSVMILNDFCTVNKAPHAQWRTLVPKIKRVLQRAQK